MTDPLQYLRYQALARNAKLVLGRVGKRWLATMEFNDHSVTQASGRTRKEAVAALADHLRGTAFK